MGSEFCALSAKLKAMRAGHLTETEYGQLLEKRTVSEACAYLKQTAYEPFLADLNENDVHRGQIEDSLDQRKRSDYLKLYVFVDLNQRRLIRCFFMRDEIDALKSVLRDCFNHEKTYNRHMDRFKGEFFEKHSDINISQLMQSESLAAVAEACKNSVFYTTLRHAVSTDADYPTVCMMLDSLYFKTLWTAIARYVEKNQRETLKKYIGQQIDYMNIMWIYRCKRYFRTPPELIYTYLIPIYYRLSKEEITAMVEADSTETCEREIAESRYSDILESDGGEFLIEHNFKRICFENAKKAYKLNPETITEVFAYFDMYVTEVENLETIIEGIRYQTDPEIVKRYIYTG